MNKHVSIALKSGKSMMYPAHALALESVKTGETYVYTIKNVYTGEVVGSPDDIEAQRLLLLLSAATQ